MAKVKTYSHSIIFSLVFFVFIDLERMPTIFNQLLTILKHIIETYQLIDSIDVLEYAAKLIHLLQGKYFLLLI